MDMFFPSSAQHLGIPSSLALNHLGERRGVDGLPGSLLESCILTSTLQGRLRWDTARQKGVRVTAASLKQPLNAATLGGFLLLPIATGPCTTG